MKPFNIKVECPNYESPEIAALIAKGFDLFTLDDWKTWASFHQMGHNFYRELSLKLLRNGSVVKREYVKQMDFFMKQLGCQLPKRIKTPTLLAVNRGAPIKLKRNSEIIGLYAQGFTKTMILNMLADKGDVISEGQLNKIIKGNKTRI
jgi:hypothetical protein